MECHVTNMLEERKKNTPPLTTDLTNNNLTIQLTSIQQQQKIDTYRFFMNHITIYNTP